MNDGAQNTSNDAESLNGSIATEAAPWDTQQLPLSLLQDLFDSPALKITVEVLKRFSEAVRDSSTSSVEKDASMTYITTLLRPVALPDDASDVNRLKHSMRLLEYLAVIQSAIDACDAARSVSDILPPIRNLCDVFDASSGEMVFSMAEFIEMLPLDTALWSSAKPTVMAVHLRQWLHSSLCRLEFSSADRVQKFIVDYVKHCRQAKDTRTLAVLECLSALSTAEMTTTLSTTGRFEATKALVEVLQEKVVDPILRQYVIDGSAVTPWRQKCASAVDSGYGCLSRSVLRQLQCEFIALAAALSEQQKMKEWLAEGDKLWEATERELKACQKAIAFFVSEPQPIFHQTTATPLPTMLAKIRALIEDSNWSQQRAWDACSEARGVLQRLVDCPNPRRDNDATNFQFLECALFFPKDADRPSRLVPLLLRYRCEQLQHRSVNESDMPAFVTHVKAGVRQMFHDDSVEFLLSIFDHLGGVDTDYELEVLVSACRVRCLNLMDLKQSLRFLRSKANAGVLSAFFQRCGILPAGAADVVSITASDTLARSAHKDLLEPLLKIDDCGHRALRAVLAAHRVIEVFFRLELTNTAALDSLRHKIKHLLHQCPTAPLLTQLQRCAGVVAVFAQRPALHLSQLPAALLSALEQGRFTDNAAMASLEQDISDLEAACQQLEDVLRHGFIPSRDAALRTLLQTACGSGCVLRLVSNVARCDVVMSIECRTDGRRDVVDGLCGGVLTGFVQQLAARYSPRSTVDSANEAEEAQLAERVVTLFAEAAAYLQVAKKLCDCGHPQYCDVYTEWPLYGDRPTVNSSAADALAPVCKQHEDLKRTAASWSQEMCRGFRNAPQLLLFSRRELMAYVSIILQRRGRVWADNKLVLHWDRLMAPHAERAQSGEGESKAIAALMDATRDISITSAEDALFALSTCISKVYPVRAPTPAVPSWGHCACTVLCYGTEERPFHSVFFFAVGVAIPGKAEDNQLRIPPASLLFATPWITQADIDDFFGRGRQYADSCFVLVGAHALRAELQEVLFRRVAELIADNVPCNLMLLTHASAVDTWRDVGGVRIDDTNTTKFKEEAALSQQRLGMLTRSLNHQGVNLHITIDDCSSGKSEAWCAANWPELRLVRFVIDVQDASSYHRFEDAFFRCIASSSDGSGLDAKLAIHIKVSQCASALSSESSADSAVLSFIAFMMQFLHGYLFGAQTCYCFHTTNGSRLILEFPCASALSKTVPVAQMLACKVTDVSNEDAIELLDITDDVRRVACFLQLPTAVRVLVFAEVVAGGAPGHLCGRDVGELLRKWIPERFRDSMTALLLWISIASHRIRSEYSLIVQDQVRITADANQCRTFFETLVPRAVKEIEWLCSFSVSHLALSSTLSSSLVWVGGEQVSLDAQSGRAHMETIRRMFGLEQATVAQVLQTLEFVPTNDNMALLFAVVERTRARAPCIICSPTGSGVTLLLEVVHQLTLAKCQLVSPCFTENSLCFTLPAASGITHGELKSFLHRVRAAATAIACVPTLADVPVVIVFDHLDPNCAPPALELLVVDRVFDGEMLNANVSIVVTVHSSGEVSPVPNPLGAYTQRFTFGNIGSLHSYLTAGFAKMSPCEDCAQLLASAVCDTHCLFAEKGVSCRDVKRVLAFVATVTRLQTALTDSSIASAGSVLCCDLLREACQAAVYFNYCCAHESVERRETAGAAVDGSAFFNFSCTTSSDPSCRISCADAASQLITDIVNTSNFALPVGVELTRELMENVLVVLLATLSQCPHRIASSLAGKPGSGKSLAVRVLSENAKGRVSPRPFFQRLPEVHFVMLDSALFASAREFLVALDAATALQKQYAHLNVTVVIDHADLHEARFLSHARGVLDEAQVRYLCLSHGFLGGVNQNRMLTVTVAQVHAGQTLEGSAAVRASDANASRNNNIVRAFWGDYTTFWHNCSRNDEAELNRATIVRLSNFPDDATPMGDACALGKLHAAIAANTAHVVLINGARIFAQVLHVLEADSASRRGVTTGADASVEHKSTCLTVVIPDKANPPPNYGGSELAGSQSSMAKWLLLSNTPQHPIAHPRRYDASYNDIADALVRQANAFVVTVGMQCFYSFSKDFTSVSAVARVLNLLPPEAAQNRSPEFLESLAFEVNVTLCLLLSPEGIVVSHGSLTRGVELVDAYFNKQEHFSLQRLLQSSIDARIEQRRWVVYTPDVANLRRVLCDVGKVLPSQQDVRVISVDRLRRMVEFEEQVDVALRDPLCAVLLLVFISTADDTELVSMLLDYVEYSRPDPHQGPHIIFLMRLCDNTVPANYNRAFLGCYLDTLVCDEASAKRFANTCRLVTQSPSELSLRTPSEEGRALCSQGSSGLGHLVRRYSTLACGGATTETIRLSAVHAERLLSVLNRSDVPLQSLLDVIVCHRLTNCTIRNTLVTLAHKRLEKPQPNRSFVSQFHEDVGALALSAATRMFDVVTMCEDFHERLATHSAIREIKEVQNILIYNVVVDRELHVSEAVSDANDGLIELSKANEVRFLLPPKSVLNPWLLQFVRSKMTLRKPDSPIMFYCDEIANDLRSSPRYERLLVLLSKLDQTLLDEYCDDVLLATLYEGFEETGFEHQLTESAAASVRRARQHVQDRLARHEVTPLSMVLYVSAVALFPQESADLVADELLQAVNGTSAFLQDLLDDVRAARGRSDDVARAVVRQTLQLYARARALLLDLQQAPQRPLLLLDLIMFLIAQTEDACRIVDVVCDEMSGTAPPDVFLSFEHWLRLVLRVCCLEEGDMEVSEKKTLARHAFIFWLSRVPDGFFSSSTKLFTALVDGEVASLLFMRSDVRSIAAVEAFVERALEVHAPHETTLRVLLEKCCAGMEEELTRRTLDAIIKPLFVRWMLRKIDALQDCSLLAAVTAIERERSTCDTGPFALEVCSETLLAHISSKVLSDTFVEDFCHVLYQLTHVGGAYPFACSMLLRCEASETRLAQHVAEIEDADLRRRLVSQFAGRGLVFFRDYCERNDAPRRAACLPHAFDDALDPSHALCNRVRQAVRAGDYDALVTSGTIAPNVLQWILYAVRFDGLPPDGMTALYDFVHSRLTHEAHKRLCRFLLKTDQHLSILADVLGTPNAINDRDRITELCRRDDVVFIDFAIQLVTTVTVEACSSPLHGIFLHPHEHKGQPAFGDLYSSTFMIHGWDCGAKMDEFGTPLSNRRAVYHLTRCEEYCLLFCVYSTLYLSALLYPEHLQHWTNTAVTGEGLASVQNFASTQRHRLVLFVAMMRNQFSRFVGEFVVPNADGATLHSFLQSLQYRMFWGNITPQPHIILRKEERLACESEFQNVVQDALRASSTGTHVRLPNYRVVTQSDLPAATREMPEGQVILKLRDWCQQFHETLRHFFVWLRFWSILNVRLSMLVTWDELVSKNVSLEELLEKSRCHASVKGAVNEAIALWNVFAVQGVQLRHECAMLHLPRVSLQTAALQFVGSDAPTVLVMRMLCSRLNDFRATVFSPDLLARLPERLKSLVSLVESEVNGSPVRAYERKRAALSLCHYRRGMFDPSNFSGVLSSRLLNACIKMNAAVEGYHVLVASLFHALLCFDFAEEEFTRSFTCLAARAPLDISVRCFITPQELNQLASRGDVGDVFGNNVAKDMMARLSVNQLKERLACLNAALLSALYLPAGEFPKGFDTWMQGCFPTCVPLTSHRQLVLLRDEVHDALDDATVRSLGIAATVMLQIQTSLDRSTSKNSLVALADDIDTLRQLSKHADAASSELPLSTYCEAFDESFIPLLPETVLVQHLECVLVVYQRHLRRISSRVDALHVELPSAPPLHGNDAVDPPPQKKSMLVIRFLDYAEWANAAAPTSWEKTAASLPHRASVVDSRFSVHVGEVTTELEAQRLSDRIALVVSDKATRPAAAKAAVSAYDHKQLVLVNRFGVVTMPLDDACVFLVKAEDVVERCLGAFLTLGALKNTTVGAVCRHIAAVTSDAAGCYYILLLDSNMVANPCMMWSDLPTCAVLRCGTAVAGVTLLLSDSGAPREFSEFFCSMSESVSDVVELARKHAGRSDFACSSSDSAETLLTAMCASTRVAEIVLEPLIQIFVAAPGRPPPNGMLFNLHAAESDTPATVVARVLQALGSPVVRGFEDCYCLIDGSRHDVMSLASFFFVNGATFTLGLRVKLADGVDVLLPASDLDAACAAGVTVGAILDHLDRAHGEDRVAVLTHKGEGVLSLDTCARSSEECGDWLLSWLPKSEVVTVTVHSPRQEEKRQFRCASARTSAEDVLTWCGSAFSGVRGAEAFLLCRGEVAASQYAATPSIDSKRTLDKWTEDALLQLTSVTRPDLCFVLCPNVTPEMVKLSKGNCSASVQQNSAICLSPEKPIGNPASFSELRKKRLRDALSMEKAPGNTGGIT